ncbi:MAG: dTMP kinase [Actinomycetota bacterium]
MAKAVSPAEEIAALRGTRPAGLKELLTMPSFSRLWQAMLTASLADWVCFVAVAALVARLGGERLGGTAVAGVMVARLLPSVLFGPIAGVMADRLDRKSVMVLAHVTRGLMYAAMPFLPVLWAIFALSFLIECLSLLWGPAKDAIIPNLVPRRQLANANSISLVTTYGTLPLGGTVFTALAGLATGIGSRVDFFRDNPESLALWLGALAFLFSARMVSGLETRSDAEARARLADRPKFSVGLALREAREGIRFLGEHQLIRAMTVGIVIAFAGVGAVIALGPIFARYSVEAGSTGFGYLVTALGIGMGAGMGLMNLFARFLDKEKIFWVAMLEAAGCLFILALMPSIALAALFTIPMGFGVGLTWVTGYTLIQENVTDEFRGRTFATLTITARMALFLALAIFPGVASAIGTNLGTTGGWPIDLSGSRPALYLAGVVVVAAALITRRGLKKSRLVRPRALALLPRLRRAEGPGILIVFEGVEGSGKGTQIERARQYVKGKGLAVVTTREPGGTVFGDRLREVILDLATGKVDPRAEGLVFAAARAQLVATVIRPALDEGKVVICDRFVDSSVAYQGFGRSLGEQDVLTLNAWATQGLFPDLVILLHLEPEEGLNRVTGSRDRIEAEDLAFHARVADAYLRIAEEHPDRYHVVHAKATEEEVWEGVKEGLDRVLARVAEGRAGPT